MKKLILLSSLFMALFFSNKIQAQDDPNIGYYVDDVKVTELGCYSFKSMVLVFPYNPEYLNYDLLRIKFFLAGPGAEGETRRYAVSEIYKANYNRFIKGNYFVIKIFSDEQKILASEGSGYRVITRGNMNYYKKNEVEAVFVAQLNGAVIVRYDEAYDAGCNCIRKYPAYQNTLLSSLGNLTLKNRVKYKKFIDDPDDEQINVTTPCDIPGTKVSDYSKLSNGSASSTNNMKSESTTNKETTTTSNNTSNTANTTSITKATALKPLEKSKPGYFANKNGGQITLEGYKNKNGQINGEVRRYEEGKLREVSTYVNDEKNGPASLYNENGNIEASGNYKNGAKDGEWKRYNENGKFAGTDVYVDGEKQ